ncbi:MFS transporter [Undibacterium sp. Di26W]|uniref:MFS transporter n=1 Tax=Undibacterium sp. Di26W TaxID=3413035 RepID=UPI003BF1A2BF
MKNLSLFHLLAYALFGFPLAMVALPIYVYVPQFYADRFGMSLTMIGTALLLTRVMDAFIDPYIGKLIDRRPHGRGFAPYIVVALPLLILGFIGLFHPPPVIQRLAFGWFFLTLIVVYFGFSIASIAHQSWGAALTQESGQRVRLTALREAFGLCGVIVTALITQFANVSMLAAVLTLALLATGWLLTKKTPVITRSQTAAHSALTLRELFADRSFRALFSVFVVNGIAAAIPATLFLFFTRDRLQIVHLSGILLLLYFLAAALSMPLWAYLAKKQGEVRTWLMAMLLSIVSFMGVVGLGAGDSLAFSVICIFSGMSLGADLALPPAILAGVIHAAGHSEKNEASYFGVWNWATKMNLALAAGLSLPLLEFLGYVPGISTQTGLQALTVAYAVLPCMLKLIAAVLLWRAPLRTV